MIDGVFVAVVDDVCTLLFEVAVVVAGAAVPAVKGRRLQ